MTQQTPTTQTKDSSVVNPRGRLIFALDATGSREATWETAKPLQAKMFRSAAPIGQLACQLVFYRGEECQKSKWVESGDQLAHLMNKIACEAGETQIAKVLRHAKAEATIGIQGLIFIGDAIEGDSIEELAALAGELGRLKAPIFAFQEGRDRAVQKAFRLMALKSGGKYFEFNLNAPHAVERLSNQLSAIARLAVGDSDALRLIGGK
jgi:hypothetical protein